MSDRKDFNAPQKIKIINYYVDEAGDGVIFNRHGKVIIGNEGCSKYFILGSLVVDNPDALTKDMEALRYEVLNDKYFKGVPSLQRGEDKTALAFHAKNDLPEIRREVFKLLMRHKLKFAAVVKDKNKLLQEVRKRNAEDSSYRYNQNELYEELTRRLFGRFFFHEDYSKSLFNISFSQRGSSTKTDALKKALYHEHGIVRELLINEIIEAGNLHARTGELIKIFENKSLSDKDLIELNINLERLLGKVNQIFNDATSFQADHVQSGSLIQIKAHQPKESAGLQAVDYFLWALQRLLEKKEDRYVEFIWSSVIAIHELEEKPFEPMSLFFFNKSLSLDQLKNKKRGI